MIEKKATKCRKKKKGSKTTKVWNTNTKGLKWCRRTAGAKKPVCGFPNRKAACRGGRKSR